MRPPPRSTLFPYTTLFKEKIAQSRDRHVELQRIDIRSDDAAGHPGIKNGADRSHERDMHVLEARRTLEMLRTEHILAVEQPDHSGIFGEVVELEFDQLADRRQWLKIVELEVALAHSHRDVGFFQHREVKVVLAVIIIIQHPLIDARDLRDLVDTSTGETVLGELGGRRFQDGTPRPVGIAQSGLQGTGSCSRKPSAALLPWRRAFRRHGLMSHHANRAKRGERTGRRFLSTTSASPIGSGLKMRSSMIARFGETSGWNSICANTSRSRSTPGPMILSPKRLTFTLHSSSTSAKDRKANSSPPPS